mgnify:CR=1 FL=1
MRLITYTFATRLIATIGAITLAMASYSATFTGSGVGTIPDATNSTCPAPGTWSSWRREWYPRQNP